jgi:hypothetical protein
MIINNFKDKEVKLNNKLNIKMQNLIKNKKESKLYKIISSKQRKKS